VKSLAPWFLMGAAFLGGLAWGQDDDQAAHESADDFLAKVKGVRREIKIIDLDESIPRFATLLAREQEYDGVLAEMATAVEGSGDLSKLLERGRDLKVAALKDLNEILKLHRGKYAGLKEVEVWERLHNAHFRNVSYENEWLVNVLDDLEERVGINIEMDARVYKFDTISFNFDDTSARAMLQMMGESLLFNWLVRGDTLYVYKERHEVLFGGEWIRQKRAAWKARQEAIENARKAAQKAALEGEKGDD